MANVTTYVELHREPGNPHHTRVYAEDVPAGWAALTPEIMAHFDACGGYCNITLDASGAPIGVVPDDSTPEEFYATLRAKNAEIETAKASLTSTDYKIIKAYEAALVGEESPYDMAPIIAERQALRDAINAAEAVVEETQEQINAFYAEANANRANYH